MSRGGKSTGKYAKWYNVEYKCSATSKVNINSFDLSVVNELTLLQKTKDQNSEEIHRKIETDKEVNNIDKVYKIDHNQFGDAKGKELLSWKDHGVYDVVPRCEKKCISARWVCTLKQTENGLIPKARLVARGFEERSDNINKESPTCSKDSLRVVLGIINQMKWQLNSIDIKTAFLQGKSIEREVYLIPPPEAKCPSDYVWSLKKCVYGLSDASLKWYQRVRSSLIDLGGKPSTLDPAVFSWHYQNKLIGVIAIHVDDFLWGGNDKFIKEIKPKLHQFFTVGNEEELAFRYLGLNINQVGSNVILDQKEYIEGLKPIKLPNLDKEERPLTKSERDLLRSKIGQLLWLSNQSRPDVCFDVSRLSVNLNNSTTADICLLNKVIRKLKNTPYAIAYSRLEGPLKVVIYTDAAFGNLPDGGSQGAYLAFLADSKRNANIISWQSKRLKRMVRSSLAAETLEMCEAIDGGLYVSALYCEIVYGKSSTRLPIEVVTDNQSLCDALASSKYVSDRRLRIDIGSLKELIADKHIEKITWVCAEEQLADFLTKNGAQART